MPISRIALLLLLACSCQSAPDLIELTDRLTERCAAFDGQVGIYVRHLEHDDAVEINADELFPTASMIKVPILGALFDRIERGELRYGDQLTYTKDRLYAGEDLLGSFADGEKVTLDKLAFLMITTSDNTASLWCQELAGTGTAINAWLQDNGFTKTRVNSRTAGREPDRERFGWGQTTPREMAELLARVRNRQLVSAAASEEMARAMGRIYWDGEALSAIPSDIATMSKQGAVSASRSEVVLVHAPHGDYVFCVITNGQKDRSWEHDNAGYVLLRDVSRILWEHFERGRPYTEPAGTDKFR
ncbi:MAG: class A beta-lactamase-related serine hydrolase [bacterium]|nr:class A beta-lactamase-related serine hydrolase [bacterium]